MSPTGSRFPRDDAWNALRRDRQAATRADELAAARVLLLQSAGDIPRSAVWNWDLKTGAIEWAQGLKTIFGHPETVTDSAWRESRIHPEDRERVALSLQRATVINDGSVWTERYRFQMANGTWAAVIERAYVLRDELGPRGVLGALTVSAGRSRVPRAPSAAGSRRSASADPAVAAPPSPAAAVSPPPPSAPAPRATGRRLR